MRLSPRAALLIADFALLFLYPIAWAAPLARAGLLPFFSGSELTIFGGIRDLWSSDVFLALIVAGFAVVTPYFKAIILTMLHFKSARSDKWIKVLEIAGKLSMADVFLLALYIVVAKGVGVGYVETAWGLYLFSALIFGSMALTYVTKRMFERQEPVANADGDAPSW